MICILVVDDDAHIRELLKHYLRSEGYIIFEAEDGEGASLHLEQQQIHLAIIDVMMSKKDGFQLCKEIRKDYDFPVILLTAKDQLVDKRKGFSVGTDDYIVKPFEPAEVLFRVKALLRRYEILNADIIQLNHTVINRKNFEVRCDNQTILLPLKEFELFAQLASHPNRTFSRDELIELIWGLNFAGDERTVDVHIKRLRDRFAKRKDDFEIKTVRGFGYKLELK